MGKILVRPLQWRAKSAPPSRDRVKVSENLGATTVAPVAPADTSLPQLPGSARTRAWDYYGSDTPNSPRGHFTTLLL